MAYTKVQIYNLALSALLLAKEVEQPDTDPSTECRVLNLNWDTALSSTLQDLDLDSLSSVVKLELLDTLDEGPWTYVYKYPTNCSFFRRIRSCAVTDNASTHISKKIAIHNGQRAVYTNEANAEAEIIPMNVPLSALSPNAALAVAYKLAFLSAPLIVGKGAKALKDSIRQDYLTFKFEAQEVDRFENFNYEDESLRSEFVQARLE